MIDPIISIETAKIAKAKDFREKCYQAYDWSAAYPFDQHTGYNDWNKFGEVSASAPTQSLLAKWLREIHGWYVIIIPTVTMCWTFKIFKVWKKDFDIDVKEIEKPPYSGVHAYDYSTYEEAMEEALKEMLSQL